MARASAALPRSVAVTAFARAGAREAIPLEDVPAVSTERLARWVGDVYPDRPVPAVAVGASNGALMHLFAAVGVPWLPQTFLVPVARRADPHRPAEQLGFGVEEVRALTERDGALQVHHMHDPNQDVLMVERLAYFRMKQRVLSAGYRDYITRVLAPGGTILLVDCRKRWPVTRLSDRHVFQPGAVGGLGPEDYLSGSSAVRRFLAEQGTGREGWAFPAPDDKAPEAEWGYEPALTDDVRRFANAQGYTVCSIGFDEPETPTPLVAELYRRWYDGLGITPTELLAETFIAVEPHWVLSRRAVPLWLTFPVVRSANCLQRYLDDAGWRNEVLVTLFPNGARSAGQAPVADWEAMAGGSAGGGGLVGVNRRRWPADFASLSRYSKELHHSRPGHPEPMPKLALDDALSMLAADGERFGVSLERLS